MMKVGQVINAEAETLFGSELWRPALETFSRVTRLTVELYSAGSKSISWGPVHANPLFELIAEAGWDPGIFSECARRCLRQQGERPAIIVSEHGLTVVGTSFVLDGENAGAAVGGYVSADFPQALAVHRMARKSGIAFARLWALMRQQQPVPERRIALYGELLQLLGDTLLREQERSRQVEQTAERLTAAGAAKDEFLAVLSHELRTPLSPILTWSHILLKSVDPQVRRGAEVIARNARLQAKLIEDLLDLNRVSLGKVSLDLHPHDLREVLAIAIESITGEAETKGVRLEVELPEPLRVSGDYVRLQQVFRNLLGNAVKFTPSRGTIRVTGQTADGFVCIRVKDDGAGIDPKFLPHVFGIFEQQEQGTQRSRPGLGIGLSVAKTLTELHQGTLTVASEGLGKGTEALVCIPLQKTLALEAAATSIAAEDSPFSGLSILAIEDTEDSRVATGYLLESLGARPLLADGGREALRLIDGGATPDLVLCDLRMPEMDGFEFIEALRQRVACAHLPVLALTALAREKDLHDTLAAGFEGLVPKPFEPAALVAAIDAAMVRRQVH